jgi:Branched-chain amino acid transport system / permease component
MPCRSTRPSATAHWGTARNSENRRASARTRAFTRGLTSILALQPRSVGAALVGGAVVVWIVGNLAANPSSFVFLLLVGVTNGAMYALVALGFTLSYTLIDLINLPHGFVFVSGAALCAYLLDALGVNEDSSFAGAALAVLITFLLVMSLCGLLSALIEVVAYRPLSNAPRQSRLVTAVGVLFILDNIVLVRTGGAPITVPDLLPNGAVFSVMGVAYTWDKLVVLVSMGLVLAGLYLGLQRTKVGRSDLDDLRREQALARSKRVAELRERAPKRTKRLRPGEEPYLQAYEDAALLFREPSRSEAEADLERMRARANGVAHADRAHRT